MATDERPTVATTGDGNAYEPGELLAARRTAAARYERARRLLRQALSLGKTYMDDGAPISAYNVLLRACRTVEQNEDEAGPVLGGTADVR